ncbi:unnamed protein product, partial [Coregonus sp. 'balchen']
MEAGEGEREETGKTAGRRGPEQKRETKESERLRAKGNQGKRVWGSSGSCCGGPGLSSWRVKKPPVITTQPVSITVFGAEDILLICEASGNPPPNFRWTKDGEAFIPANDPGLSVSPGSGTFMSTGVVSGPMSQYEGKYSCYADNALGTAVSNEVQLITENTPALQKEQKVKKNVEEGESVVLKCNPPFSIVPPVIHWMDKRMNHIELNDRVTQGRDGNLYFSHVTADDTRIDYTCNVQYLSARTILSKEPIILNVTTSNSVVRSRRPQMMRPSGTHSTYHALRGQSLDLECIVQGLPTPTIQWVRKDGQLSESRTSIDLSDHLLRFSNISESDGGEYQCSANNSQGRVTHTYTVSVEAAPYWTKEPVSQLYAPGETVRLDCQADGIPSPAVAWSINGIPITGIDPDPRRTVKDGALILRDVVFTDTAVYQCQAHNKHGTILVNTYIFVIELPPQILSADGETYTVTEGQKAVLHCQTFGSPRPKVTWERNSSTSLLAEPRVNLLTNGNLQITNVSHGDEGLYTCSVSNTNLSINTDLDVLNRTVILSPPGSLRVQPGKTAILTCLAQVDPKLTPPQIQWRRSKQKLFQSYDEDKYTFEGPDLIVANVQTEDEGVYTCEVITNLDMAEASGSIMVVDRPDPPTQLQVSGPKDRNVTLSWTAGDDHNSPVIVPMEAPMNVGVMLLNSSAIRVTWEAVDQETVRGHLLGYKIHLTRFGSRGHHRGRRAREPETSVVVETGPNEENRPYSHYAFTVTVFNSKGEGPPSETMSFETDEGGERKGEVGEMREAAPGPPMSLLLDSPADTEMTLHWTPPAQPNGVLKGYLLQYQQSVVKSDDSPMQVETIDDHKVTHLTLKQLDPHSRYRFYLRGRTSAGDGEPIIREGATTLDGGGGKWMQSEKLNSSASFYQLKGLTPGSQYRLRFTFSNNAFWETEIRTKGAVKDKEEGQVDSEARPMKDETFGEYSIAVTEVNMEDSLVSQYSRPSEATPDPGTLQESSPLNPTPTTNGLPNSAAILD